MMGILKKIVRGVLLLLDLALIAATLIPLVYPIDYLKWLRENLFCCY